MPVRIYTNTTSLIAQNILSVNNSALSKSVQRISSGLRINSAADDAAGLAISDTMQSDVQALTQAQRNANDGVSLTNVADGAMAQQSTMLIRLRELSSQSSTGTVGSTQRATIELEFDALRKEIDRIASTTAFNGQNLIDGSLASTLSTTNNHILIQIGLDSSANSHIDLNSEINLSAITTSALGLASLSVTSAANALSALTLINSAISVVDAGRGKLGALQNRLGYAISNLQTTSQNLTSAESSIRDADIASEVATLTRNQILVQASTAMVGQANLIPQSVLTLLR